MYVTLLHTNLVIEETSLLFLQDIVCSLLLKSEGRRINNSDSAMKNMYESCKVNHK